MSVLTFGIGAPELTRFSAIYAGAVAGVDFKTESGTLYASFVSTPVSGFQVKGAYSGTGAQPGLNIGTLQAREFASGQLAFTFAAIGGAYAVADLAGFQAGGEASAAFLLSRADEIHGTAGRDHLEGFADGDQLFGNAGADLLDGGAGKDTMAGGADDDIYFVDNFDDVIVESAGGGAFDWVKASATFYLAADDDIEKLSTASDTGTDVVKLRGNALAQTIVGNDGDNSLSDGGKGEADTLVGRKGNDLYRVYDPGDTIVEAANEGTDTVQAARSFDLLPGVHVEKLSTIDASATTKINLYGNPFAQTITGNAGDNLLSDGGSGKADTLVGGKGNDIYRVYNSGDVIVEKAGQGTDIVLTAVSYTVAAGVYVEQLSAIDTAATTSIDLIGNANALSINGNNGPNLITTLSNANTTMRGMGGDDTYIVYGTNPSIKETKGGGNDTLLTSTQYVMRLAADSEVEVLAFLNPGSTVGGGLFGNDFSQRITGSAGPDALRGNGGDDIISGGAAHDHITGSAGNDTLTGGADNDYFVFTAKLDAVTNVDTITDYNKVDTIFLYRNVFTNLGPDRILAEAAFVANAQGVATTAAHRIIYETDTGGISYDPDGSGAAASTLFAIVDPNLPMRNIEFTVF